MKRRRTSLIRVLCAALLLLTLCGCGEAGELESRLMEAEAALSQAEATIAELESNIDEAQEAKSALESENDALESKVEMLSLQLEESNQSYILKYNIYTEAPKISACIVSDDVFYCDPWFEAEQGSYVESGYATVILQATVTNMITGHQDFWYLIEFDPPYASCNTIGWVPTDSVVEYGAENKTDIFWPVSLRDGAVVYKDNKCSVVLDDDISWAKLFSIRDTVNDVAYLGIGGYGSTLYVRSEDVIYP